MWLRSTNTNERQSSEMSTSLLNRGNKNSRLKRKKTVKETKKKIVTNQSVVATYEFTQEPNDVIDAADVVLCARHLSAHCARIHFSVKVLCKP